MSDSNKTGANLQHPLSVGKPAPKIPFRETPEFNPKDYIGFCWHKGDKELIEQHAKRCETNNIHLELPYL